MRINIIGASGAGCTTLGQALAAATGYPYIDSDDYYWDNSTAEHFTLRRDAVLRNTLLADHLAAHNHWILGGPVMSWGLPETIMFDLVVFLHIPHHVRMARLKKREHERYGDVIFTDAVRHRQYMDFMNWASGYDTNSAAGVNNQAKPSSRNMHYQLNWLQSLSCPVLQITGDTTVEQRVNRVEEAIKKILNAKT